jgi:hypothetical protein
MFIVMGIRLVGWTPVLVSSKSLHHSQVSSALDQHTKTQLFTPNMLEIKAMPKV